MANEDKPQDHTVRGADYVEKYSNNVRFEASAWDLKLLFGALDQFAIPVTLRQHTGMTLPWAQAKVLLYFLYVNLTFHELDNGQVRVLPQTRPPDIDSVIDKSLLDAPITKDAIERIKRLGRELFEGYAPQAD